VTSPAGTEPGVAVKVMGPSVPFVSPTATLTVVPDDGGTVTPPPPADVLELDEDELPQPATARTDSARTAVIQPARYRAIEYSLSDDFS
jgi:hypothetical protein